MTPISRMDYFAGQALAGILAYEGGNEAMSRIHVALAWQYARLMAEVSDSLEPTVKANPRRKPG